MFLRQLAVADDPKLERAVLQYLQATPHSRAALVRRTGRTDLQVQVLLDELIGATFVVRRPQSAGALYELTQYGTGRLHLLDQLAAAKARAVPAPKPRTNVRRPPWLMPPKPKPTPTVTDADRLDCNYALANLFGEGRLSRQQLRNSRTMVRLAQTPADLAAILEPLLAIPAPPPPKRRMSVWQWIGWRILGGPRPQ